MKWLLIILLGVHGMIHLLGAARGFQWIELDALIQPVSRMRAWLWLLAFILFIIAMLALQSNQATWWIWSGTAILLSQILILNAWQDARIGTVANGILLLATVVGFGVFRFDKMTVRDCSSLIQHAATALHWPNQSGPPSVIKWINRSGIPDKTLLRVTLRQTGRMRTTPNGKWLAFTAEQEFTPQFPGFIWTTRVDVFPGVFLLGRDRYDQGEGRMQIDLYGLIPVVNASGDELDQGTLLRYLGETVWFPSGALHPAIHWKEEGQNQAVATMTWGKTQASGTFTFTSEGDFQKYQALRYYNRPKGATLENWAIQAEPNSFRTFQGVRIPTRFNVSWQLPEGDFHWLELEVKEVYYQFDQ